MKRYDAYKESGVEWIGEIPAHWEVKSGLLLFEIKKNGISKEELNGKKVIHYSIPNIQEFGDGILEEGGEIDSNKFIVEGDELLYSKLNPRKETMCLTSLNSFLQVCSTEFLVIKPKLFLLKYAFYIFKSHFLKEEISSSVQSSTKSHQRANPSDIHRLLFPLPPLDEQTSIAEFLDRKTSQIDSLVEKKKRLIELLKEEKTAVINQAVTKGIDPNVKMKDSGVEWLGEIPEHWEVKKLKWVADLKSGEGIKSEEIDFTGTFPVYGGNGIMGYTEKYNSSKNDIIIGRVGAKCGNVRLVSGSKWISDNALVVTVFTEVDLEYLAILLKSLNLNSLANQNAQPLITGTLVKDKIVVFPPFDEQKLIVGFIGSHKIRIDSAISKIEKEMELLQEYRTALISEMVTGKVRVGE